MEESQNESKDIEGGKEEMKHNVFDNDKENKEEVLSHSDTEAIFSDARRYGSLKDSVLAHGITNLEYLFPEDTNLNKVPEFISRDTGWVKNVMSSVHHTPFSRIKSQFADITADEARAKGYTKGKLTIKFNGTLDEAEIKAKTSSGVTAYCMVKFFDTVTTELSFDKDEIFSFFRNHIQFPFIIFIKTFNICIKIF